MTNKGIIDEGDAAQDKSSMTPTLVGVGYYLLLVGVFYGLFSAVFRFPSVILPLGIAVPIAYWVWFRTWRLPAWSRGARQRRAEGQMMVKRLRRM